MAVDSGTVQVVMPAMGDSVSEGTVLEWHKGVGDQVQADETIVEISTGETVDIVTPTGGESVTAGTILEWSVKAGEVVREGDTVVEISTDKVDMELPAPVSGTLIEVLAGEGDTVTVGQVIGRMQADAS